MGGCGRHAACTRLAWRALALALMLMPPQRFCIAAPLQSKAEVDARAVEAQRTVRLALRCLAAIMMTLMQLATRTGFPQSVTQMRTTHTRMMMTMRTMMLMMMTMTVQGHCRQSCAAGSAVACLAILSLPRPPTPALQAASGRASALEAPQQGPLHLHLHWELAPECRTGDRAAVTLSFVVLTAPAAAALQASGSDTGSTAPPASASHHPRYSKPLRLPQLCSRAVAARVKRVTEERTAVGRMDAAAAAVQLVVLVASAAALLCDAAPLPARAVAPRMS